MRLIDVDELKKALGITSEDCNKCGWGSYESCGRGKEFEDICITIDNTVPIDAIPVVHGRWLDCDTQCGISCSVCGTPMDDFCHSIDYIDLEYKPNYCPHCGAQMDGKDGEEHE